MNEWMLCEACNYSWLRDPTRAIPAQCVECQAPWPTLIGRVIVPDDDNGLTWQQRRQVRQREATVEALFFMDCDKHGRHVPIHPFHDGVCFFCAEEAT